MYSPKIREDLIPDLYRIAREERMPMTRLVSDVLETYITYYKAYSSPAAEHAGALEKILQQNGVSD